MKVIPSIWPEEKTRWNIERDFYLLIDVYTILNKIFDTFYQIFSILFKSINFVFDLTWSKEIGVKYICYSWIIANICVKSQRDQIDIAINRYKRGNSI